MPGDSLLECLCPGGPCVWSASSIFRYDARVRMHTARQSVSYTPERNLRAPDVHTGSLQGTGQGDQQLLSAGAVLQALLQIRVNGIAVVPAQHASAKDRVALAIYTQASMLNHSCLPNTALSFNGRQLVLHASTHISKGEAVLTCYGPQVLLSQRRHALIFVDCLHDDTRHMTTLCTCSLEKWSPVRGGSCWRSSTTSPATAGGASTPAMLSCGWWV